MITDDIRRRQSEVQKSGEIWENYVKDFVNEKLKEMDSKERTRAAYQHACLQHVIGKKMTNESLRTRLGIKKSSFSLAYRIIRDAIQENLVKPQGDKVGAGKSAFYIPFWA